MFNRDLIGWASSLVLLLTLAVQTLKQYRSDSQHGVSIWLYVGEMAASVGFATYSTLLHNRVFLVTNVLGFVTASAGLVIYWRAGRKPRASGAAVAVPATA